MEDINNILFLTVPPKNSKQSYLQGWDFELKTYKETCVMLERMEFAEQVHERGTPVEICPVTVDGPSSR